MTNKILIAHESKLIRTLMKEGFKDSDYEILETDNGTDAIKILFDQFPFCIFASEDLSPISGADLCHIIKNRREFKKILIILTASESNRESNFWAENCRSDGFFIPSEESIKHIAQFMELKRAELNKVPVEILSRDEPQKLTDEDVIKYVASSFSKELFELYTIRSAFNAENYIWDLEPLLMYMAKALGSIYNYDALGIIINDNPFMEYYDIVDSLSKADYDDFQKICRSDFATRISKIKEYNWNKSIVLKNTIESINTDEKPDRKKLKNYEIFPANEMNKFPLTIHIGSCTEGKLSNKTRNRLNFFLETYSPVVEKVLAFQKGEYRERKMRTAFSRFLPEKVIDRIIEGDSFEATNAGEQRKVAILMADIRGFTAITEQNEPDKIINFLNNYFTRMGKIIEKHGGTIDKFMGDEIMAIFGVPESYKYNAERAANAALEMIEELKEIDTSELKMPENISSLRIGIGIHYGLPIAGTIGSEDKKEYTVIGDDVNLASRIEDLTKLYDLPILISGAVKMDIEAAAQDTANSFYIRNLIPRTMRYIDNVKVKGKSIPVELYELTSDLKKYSVNFSENYSKGLYQYMKGNFNGAQDYLRIAKILNKTDVPTQVLLDRCIQFEKEKPADWDGAITLKSK